MRKARLALMVGARGRGSNMKAIADACTQPGFSAEVAVVIGSKADSPAIELAKEMGLSTEVVGPPYDAYGQRLTSALLPYNVDLICLAGYMRLLPAEVLKAFPNRVLNIHPALLPKFGGKGMYGEYVHEAVLAAGETESGCTVHLVDLQYDEGPILLQRRCKVLSNDTVESLAARVLQEEHIAYPEAIEMVVKGLSREAFVL